MRPPLRDKQRVLPRKHGGTALHRPLTDEERQIWGEAAQQFTPLRRKEKVEIPLAERVLKPRTRRLFGQEWQIDLHGQTEESAYRLLCEALAEATQQGMGRIWVITGQGRGGEGALKRNVPRWLEANTQVRGWKLAPAAEGGAGALIVHVKKGSHVRR